MKKVLVIGDLHISDRYSGKHNDYFQNCLDVIEMITKTLKERQITHLFILGDLVGMTEKNMKSRDSLFLLMKTFQTWNELTQGNVYSLRGNHDIGSKTTDFDILVALGFVKMADYVDVESGLRLHAINYGEEKRVIQISPDRYNVALMHNNIQVEGQTTWFRAGEGIELSTMDNLYGVEMVLAGHIHNPSEKLVQTSIKDKSVSLFYPGCPTRPKKDPHIWDTCFGIQFVVEDDNVTLDQVTFKLKPAKELFASTFDDIEDEEDSEEDTMYDNVIDIKELSAILEELQQYNIGGQTDYKSQIMRVAGVDKEAAELAVSYIEKVEGELNNVRN